MDKLILASASPRRSQLLSQVGIPFEIHAGSYEEKAGQWTPQETVQCFSRGKAASVLEEVPDGKIVLGADTVVACDGEILGKPRDEEDAFRMLYKLQGRSHEVYTGVTLLKKENETIKEKSFVEVTRVDFVEMTEEQIRAYIATGDCMDKAGAYGIQGYCAAYISGICGDYNNVVGLPVCRVCTELRNF